jgi:hypothetical protein
MCPFAIHTDNREQIKSVACDIVDICACRRQKTNKPSRPKMALFSPLLKCALPPCLAIALERHAVSDDMRYECTMKSSASDASDNKAKDPPAHCITIARSPALIRSAHTTGSMRQMKMQALLRSGVLATSIANAVRQGVRPDAAPELSSLMLNCGFSDSAHDLASMITDLSAALQGATDDRKVFCTCGQA